MPKDSLDMRRRFQKLEHMSDIGRLPVATGFRSHFNRGQEKLPPRITMKGISIAVRVLGNEIRDFTQRKTGKDLVTLCRSGRPEIFEKLTSMKLTFDAHSITNKLKTVRFDELGSKLNSKDFVANLGSLSGSCCEDFFIHDDVLASALVRRLDLQPAFSSASCKSNEIFEDSLKQSALNYVETSHLSKTAEKLRLRERFQIFPDKSLLKYDNLSVTLDTALNVMEDYDWKTFVSKDQWSADRKLLNGDGLYVYRIQGRYDDVSAYSFYSTQVDLDYRLSWDHYAIRLCKVDEPSATSDVIHWVTKCPYPMKNREYVFERKFGIVPDENAVVILSRATSHNDIPEKNDLIRVNTYGSEMVIKPLGNFEENGVEFTLTYFDDPQSNLPTYLLDMITKTGIVEGMKKIHAAAVEHQENHKDASANGSPSTAYLADRN